MLNRKSIYSGFTVIELVIVLVVAGVIATVISVRWPGFSINLNAQAELLADDIRYTQNLAMTKAQRHRLVKTSANSYQIADSTGAVVVMPSGASSVTFGSGISFGSITNLPNNLIGFNSQGAPYVDTGTPGTALSTVATIALTSSSGTSIVSIYPETGWVVTS